jgi:hypothetical protein
VDRARRSARSRQRGRARRDDEHRWRLGERGGLAGRGVATSTHPPARRQTTHEGPLARARPPEKPLSTRWPQLRHPSPHGWGPLELPTQSRPKPGAQHPPPTTRSVRFGVGAWGPSTDGRLLFGFWLQQRPRISCGPVSPLPSIASTLSPSPVPPHASVGRPGRACSAGARAARARLVLAAPPARRPVRQHACAASAMDIIAISPSGEMP